MKYKTVEIPRPEWCEIGTLVKSKSTGQIGKIIGAFEGNIVADFKALCQFRACELEPVTAWEPTPGEYVAAWDAGCTYFGIAKYEGRHQTGRFIVDGSIWSYVARITGVNCACSVEELKARTDWL